MGYGGNDRQHCPFRRFVLFLAAASYFFVSLGLGVMTAGGREVVWLRYFEWSITTPILVLGVIVLTQRTALAMWMMVLDFIMILTGFIATVTAGTVKHMAFIASSFVFILLMYLMVKKATQAAGERPGKTRKLFMRLRNFLILVWTAYPVAWVLSTDGYAIIGFTTSSTMFLVLDVVAKIGFRLPDHQELHRSRCRGHRRGRVGARVSLSCSVPSTRYSLTFVSHPHIPI